MDAMKPMAVRRSGAKVHRRNLANLERAGLEIVQADDFPPAGSFEHMVASRRGANP